MIIINVDTKNKQRKGAMVPFLVKNNSIKTMLEAFVGHIKGRP